MTCFVGAIRLINIISKFKVTCITSTTLRETNDTQAWTMKTGSNLCVYIAYQSTSIEVSLQITRKGVEVCPEGVSDMFGVGAGFGGTGRHHAKQARMKEKMNRTLPDKGNGKASKYTTWGVVWNMHMNGYLRRTYMSNTAYSIGTTCIADYSS